MTGDAAGVILQRLASDSVTDHREEIVDGVEGIQGDDLTREVFKVDRPPGDLFPHRDAHHTCSPGLPDRHEIEDHPICGQHKYAV
jgi:hypothetical protein